MRTSTSFAELDCARLALFGLRQMIPADVLPVAERDALLVNGTTITEQDLLTRLAAARKPLACAAQVVNGTLEITWQPLEDLPHDFAFHQKCRELLGSRGGVMWFVVDLYGEIPEATRVLCAGPSDSMVLPIDVVEQWSRDYSGFSWSGDYVDNPHAGNDPLYMKARSLGAYGILRFSPPGRGAEVTISISLDPPTQEEGFEEAARRCEQDAREVEGLLPTFASSDHFRSVVDHFAEECRRFFGAAIPPGLAEILGYWDRLKNEPAA